MDEPQSQPAPQSIPQPEPQPAPAQSPGEFTTIGDLSQEESVAQSQEFQQQEVKKPVKPKSWLDSKKTAYIMLGVGMAVIVVVFYFLFHSIGVI